MSDCWPEQEAIEKWFDEYVREKYGIHHSNQNLMELKKAVTKPRLDLQEQLEQKDKEIELSEQFIEGLSGAASRLKTRNEKLEQAIQKAIDDDDSWGADVTMQLMLDDVLNEVK